MLGPLGNRRANDPGAGIDTDLLNQQSDATQLRYDVINQAYEANQFVNALEAFLGLPAGNTNNVVWQLNNNNRYAVTGRMAQQPGTAGYFYDNYGINA